MVWYLVEKFAIGVVNITTVRVWYLVEKFAVGVVHRRDGGRVALDVVLRGVLLGVQARGVVFAHHVELSRAVGEQHGEGAAVDVRARPLRGDGVDAALDRVVETLVHLVLLARLPHLYFESS